MKKILIEESVKTIFTVIVALIAVTFWEKQKIVNSVSFEKRIEIIADERKNLMENAVRYSETWNLLYQYMEENQNKNCLESNTFTSCYNKLQRICDNTDLILVVRS